MNNIEKGRLGEHIAAEYLKSKGMVLLAQNYRSGKSEIDLIMSDGEEVVFIEVKARMTDDYGRGAVAVTDKKQRMIIQGACAYCAENGLYDERIRFDVAEVDLHTKRVVAYIENAFIS